MEGVTGPTGLTGYTISLGVPEGDADDLSNLTSLGS